MRLSYQFRTFTLLSPLSYLPEDLKEKDVVKISKASFCRR